MENNNNIFLGKIEKRAAMLIMVNMVILSHAERKIINYLNFYYLKK